MKRIINYLKGQRRYFIAGHIVLHNDTISHYHVIIDYHRNLVGVSTTLFNIMKELEPETKRVVVKQLNRV
jgi:uncharacterized Fe-S radical SAM superfamily protein PflX